MYSPSWPVENVAHGPVGGHHTYSADAPFVCQPLLQQQVDVGSLVSAVKVAGADVGDADTDLAAVVGRGVDRQVCQC